MAKEKQGKKVRCALCKSQYRGFCVVKKVSVSLNKSRVCNRYKFDQEKVKVKQVLPTIRLPFAQKQLDKEMRKAEMKQIREAIKEQKRLEKEGPIQESRIWKPYSNEKFPLTGDLSRFTTTGTTKKDEEK